MVMITLYAKQKKTQMYRTDFWTLWEKARVGCFERTASKHVYYLGWNRSPAQVGCMRQVLGAGSLGRPRGIGWRGRWEGGSGWGIHVTPWLIHVNVWQNPLQYCKVISLQLIKINEKKKNLQFSSVQSFSHVQLFAIPWTAAHQASLSITNSWSFVNSCASSQWCHPTTSSSVVPFSSCLQSGSFPVSQFFTSGGQSIRVSASASVLPMNIQDWFPLGWTGWISLQFKGLSRVFSNTTVQKHQFFSAQLSLQSNSHNLTWLLEKP